MLKRMTRKVVKERSRILVALLAVAIATMAVTIKSNSEASGRESQEEAVPLKSSIAISLTDIRGGLPEPKENYTPEVEEPTWRYEPTEEELEFAYRLAFSEAGNEEPIGQTAVIEVALNAVDAGYADTILEEFTRSGRYSSVIDGVPQVPAREGGFRPVTDEDLSETLKEAVLKAFQGERVTEEALKAQAEAQGLYDEIYWKGGALYFFNWDCIGERAKESRNQERMPVRIEIGNHTFARYWQ